MKYNINNTVKELLKTLDEIEQIKDCQPAIAKKCKKNEEKEKKDLN